MSPLTAAAIFLLPLTAAVVTTPVRGGRAARQTGPDSQYVEDSAVRNSRVARQAEPGIEPVGIQSADIYVVRRTNSTSASPTVNPVPACNASGYDTEFGEKGQASFPGISRVARQIEPDIQSADIYVVRRTNSSSASPTVNPEAACNASGYDTEFGSEGKRASPNNDKETTEKLERSPFTFKCGPNYALTTIRSTYCSAPGDRAWKFSCTYMGLGHQECYWSPFVNDVGSVLFYQCPFNSIVTGFYSEFDSSQNDRRWKVKCCRTEKSILYNCQNSLPANALTEDLKFTVFGNYFLRGVLATFKRNVRRGEM
ncbi:hypothetical protein Bbelb_095090 [Branchiostoma belcheri]|nr:hypothetical protein Bbelb_095090 [Branchiostoma belcheri]